MIYPMAKPFTPLAKEDLPGWHGGEAGTRIRGDGRDFWLADIVDQYRDGLEHDQAAELLQPITAGGVPATYPLSS